MARLGKRERAVLRLERARDYAINAAVKARSERVDDKPLRTSWIRDANDIVGKASVKWGFYPRGHHDKGKSLIALRWDLTEEGLRWRLAELPKYK